MRKKLLPFFIGLLFQTSALKADEGMWTLYNLPPQVYETMQSYGFQIPYNDLYNGETSLKSTVVNFSGFCSGVVVSPDGLVFTNHHCGFEAIRSHSTVEHDYMLNGFYAKDYSEELPNENMFVSFMVDQKDITDIVEAKGYNLRDDYGKRNLIDSIQNAMSDEIKKQDSTLHVKIDPFYEGNRWYATTYQDFCDLRLVFAVPKSMGKFGGETDNWMWPRQTCDFSVFRIYADKDNKPAMYSKDNKPYHPKRWAQVSLQGYNDGDYAMTIGYPGSTNRYLSSYGIRQRRNGINTPRAQVRGIKQEVMKRHMRADEAVRIKYDSKYAQSANYWKNSIGMNKCIDSIGIISQKKEYEERLEKWQNETDYTGVKRVDFDLLKRLYDKNEKLEYIYTMWGETFTRWSNVEFNVRALKLYNGMEAKGPQDDPKKSYNEFEDNSDQWDEETDKEMMAVLLKNYREHVDKEWLPLFYKEIDEEFGGDYTKYVEHLYKKSFIMQPGKKIYFNKKGYNKDAGVKYGVDVMDIYAMLSEQSSEIEDSIEEQEKRLCAAKLRMEADMPHYSDANFTMRLSYGQVGGFELGGKPSGYYTESKSIVDKMNKGDKVVDYYAEPVMKDLLSKNDFGKYQDSKTGKMQLCFLTNNDITGGNSGSPMFNGKGELIGLAFDGNWDSLSSDINFDSRLARCIGVDIRYVLYMMDRWGHAERLLDEINAK